MSDLFSVLGEPGVLWSLFGASLVLVLLDYLLPVDWLAYLGYGCFALFVGATIPAGPTYSMAAVALVAVGMLLLHQLYLSQFLTNAPRLERDPTSIESS